MSTALNVSPEQAKERRALYYDRARRLAPTIIAPHDDGSGNEYNETARVAVHRRNQRGALCADEKDVVPILEQAHADLVVEGFDPSGVERIETAMNNPDTKIVVVIGPAGTGKTTCLNYLRQKHGEKRVAVMTPTAVTGRNIMARTIYSLLRMKPVKSKRANAEAKVLFHEGLPYQKRDEELLDYLFIDEIGFIGSHVLDEVACNLYKRANPTLLKEASCSSPFPATKTILFGDPLQLPPIQPKCFVRKDGVTELLATTYEAFGESKKKQRVYVVTESQYDRNVGRFREINVTRSLTPPDWYVEPIWFWHSAAFQWAEKNGLVEYVFLDDVHRQKDNEYQETLMRLRKGAQRLTPLEINETCEFLMDCANEHNIATRYGRGREVAITSKKGNRKLWGYFPEVFAQKNQKDVTEMLPGLEEFPDGRVILSGRTDTRRQINEYYLSLIKEDKTSFIAAAHRHWKDEYKLSDPAEVEALKAICSVMDVETSLELKIGAQVRITENIALCNGAKSRNDSYLINGTIGRVVEYRSIAEVVAPALDSVTGKQTESPATIILDNGLTIKRFCQKYKNVGVFPKARKEHMLPKVGDPVVMIKRFDNDEVEAVIPSYYHSPFVPANDVEALNLDIGTLSKQVLQLGRRWELAGSQEGSAEYNELRRAHVKLERFRARYWACVQQMPLRLAWAETIHSTQGSTIDKVLVCSFVSPYGGSELFERQQLYVASSRCREASGLALTHLVSASAFPTSHDVHDWLEEKRKS